MVLWWLTGLSGGLTLSSLWGVTRRIADFWTLRTPRSRLLELAGDLLALQEALDSGLVPPAKIWNSIRSGSPPWGPQSADLLEALRSRGASILPSVRRLREAIHAELEYLAEARSGTAQALSQGAVCGGMGPILGAVLYLTLPSLEAKAALWICLILVVATIGLAAAAWIVRMADQARRGGRTEEDTAIRVAGVLALERIIALTRAGTPPDLAWGIALAAQPQLTVAWGGVFWQDARSEGAAHLGWAIRRAVQVSTLQGQSCLERLEGLQREFSLEARASVKRELALLPGRALKPLFILVLPSVFLLLISAFFVEGVEGGLL